MLCNDPPERAVLGRSSGIQEVHVELLQVILRYSILGFYPVEVMYAFFQVHKNLK